ncbi:MAG: hypothetical protein K1X85_03000 [Ignavibacteria bacterium]|nr:hypothetical protein [Ignavibacteria bacterium]
MNYKAIEILKSLTKSELSDCATFMNSAYTNPSPKVAALFSKLVVYHPEFQMDGVTEESLSKEIAPHLKYNRSSMKNLFADLAEALDAYLISINLAKKIPIKWDLLREEYFRRDLWKLMEKNIKTAEKYLQNPESFGADHFLDSSNLLVDKCNWLAVTKLKSGGNYANEFNTFLDERAMYIAGFFVKELVRQYENVLTVNRTFSPPPQKSFTEKLFEAIDFESLIKLFVREAKGSHLSATFEIHEAMFKCFSDTGDEANYFRYKKVLMKLLGILNSHDVRFHLIRLVKYCMNKIDEHGGISTFDRELFNVYKFILEKGYYKPGVAAHIPVELYRTIILQSLKLKEFGYARYIIENFRNEIPADKRDNMDLYARALLCFHSNQYDEAMENCQKVKLNHFLLKFEIKDLMLMTAYEKGLDGTMRSLLDTYRHLLRNDSTLSKKEKAKYRNFLTAVSKLYSVRNSGNISECAEIERLLENDISNKVWLIEKVKELNSAAKRKKTNRIKR